jgi:hypothetical protein
MGGKVGNSLVSLSLSEPLIGLINEIVVDLHFQIKDDEEAANNWYKIKDTEHDKVPPDLFWRIHCIEYGSFGHIPWALKDTSE